MLLIVFSELPQEVTSVLATADSVSTGAAPQLHEIVSILKRNELELSSKSINVRVIGIDNFMYSSNSYFVTGK